MSDNQSDNSEGWGQTWVRAGVSQQMTLTRAEQEIARIVRQLEDEVVCRVEGIEIERLTMRGAGDQVDTVQRRIRIEAVRDNGIII